MGTIRNASGDKLVYAGELISTIYFVSSGALEVKLQDEVMGILGKIVR